MPDFKIDTEFPKENIFKLNGKADAVTVAESKLAEINARKKALEAEFAKEEIDAKAILDEIELKKKEAYQIQQVNLKEKRDELLAHAEILKTHADEMPGGSDKQIELLAKSRLFQNQAKEIHLDSDPQTTQTPDDNEVSAGWFARNKNLIMALLTSVLLAVASWYVMRWIKVEDPQASPYDGTTFQKFLVTLCFFCALQGIKYLSVVIYYPVIHRFKSNVQEPSFDFSLYFKNELTPIQQVCISIVIPFWFALEFILLFSAKL